MINFIIYNLAGEILRYGTSQRELIFQQGGANEFFTVGVPDDPSNQYVVDGELRYYSDAEEAAKRALALGWVWKMPERIAVDLRTLGMAKVAAQERINAARNCAVASFDRFSHAGVVYDGNPLAQSNIGIAADVARSESALPRGFSWRSFDNSDIPMDKAQILALQGSLLGAKASLVFQSHATARTLKARIEVATSNAQADTVVWPNT